MLSSVGKFIAEVAMIAVISGIIAFLLGSLLGAIIEIAMFSGLIAVILAYIMLKKSKVTRDAPEFLLLLVAVGIVGSLIAGFVPGISNYILSVNVTVSGLAWAIFYVTLGLYIIRNMLGWK